ncbi:MarR family transcriptional regulator [Ktedonosporobacter rubrisoli]|uniref:MarR family transcriptional regulator n=1 Tax=Ktedonosporobacter rubrisoli TaxID=2509675 RepID=A0A4P6JL73_KTERU|nr:MarR family transcriptional regulator [Ktedonosporobacter rubrisoli]QBD75742.1 MarR family transcriptional regulator [Ktedonosporobacter rubrisoli]
MNVTLQEHPDAFAPSAQPLAAKPSQPSAVEVLQTLAITTHLVQRNCDTFLAEQAFPAKISEARLRLLSIVEEAGSIRMSDLASRLHVSPRTITDIVDGLERASLLRRVPDQRDRRVIYLELTEGASVRMAHLYRVQAEHAEELLAYLDTEQRQQLLNLLHLLQRNLLTDGAGSCG